VLVLADHRRRRSGVAGAVNRTSWSVRITRDDRIAHESFHLYAEPDAT
jgi:hypothetical protein